MRVLWWVHEMDWSDSYREKEKRKKERKKERKKIKGKKKKREEKCVDCRGEGRQRACAVGGQWHVLVSMTFICCESWPPQTHAANLHYLLTFLTGCESGTGPALPLDWLGLDQKSLLLPKGKIMIPCFWGQVGDTCSNKIGTRRKRWLPVQQKCTKPNFWTFYNESLHNFSWMCEVVGIFSFSFLTVFTTVMQVCTVCSIYIIYMPRFLFGFQNPCQMC